MREALVILTVLLILLILTAIRYRKQLLGVIHIWRMLKNARSAASTGNKEIREPGSVLLVNCAKCGTWVSQADAIKLNSRTFLCSTKCVETPARQV